MSQAQGPFGTAIVATAMADTGFAATVAARGSDAIAPPEALRATRPSVLPRVERDHAGFRVVHEGAERYRFVKRIGAGGMGEVERAEDVDIGRPVAIKRLLPGAATPEGLARFVDEVRIVGTLEHPNVVPVHDVGIDAEGRYFFVMKYVEGDTLETTIEKLQARDPQALAEYPLARRIEIVMELLKALEYAHAQGVVHRDIKPSNIILGRYGELYLMDWGISRKLTAREHGFAQEPSGGSVREQLRTTRHGALIGTPAYMSPEQARGDLEKVDARSDLYAVCVLFHELVSLRYCFADRCASLDQLLAAIQHVPLPMHHLAAAAPGHPGVPSELAHFLARGLQKDPARRWQSASDMLAELYAIQDGRVRVQCVGTFTKRMTREAGRFVDRRPILAFSLFVLVAFAMVGSLLQALIRLALR
jgi:serine/threonine-protein kinase